MIRIRAVLGDPEIKIWWMNKPDVSDPENKFISFGAAWHRPYARTVYFNGHNEFRWWGLKVEWQKGLHLPEIEAGWL